MIPARTCLCLSLSASIQFVRSIAWGEALSSVMVSSSGNGMHRVLLDVTLLHFRLFLPLFLSQLRHTLSDSISNTSLSSLTSDPQSIFDRLRMRATMRNNSRTIHTKQGHPAILGIVEAS